MAKARFQLRSSKDVTKSVPIYLVVEHKGRELLKYPTGVSVTPKQWNKEKKEVRKTASVPYETHNQTLGGLMEVTNRTFAELNLQNTPITGDAVRKALDIHTKKIKTFDGTFLGFITLELEKLPNKINIITGRKYSKQTLSKYQCLYNVVAEMEKDMNTKFTFDSIDIDFYYALLKHLQSKGFQPNTIGSKYITPLRTILSDAESQNIKVNPVFRKRFKAPSEEPFKVYLNLEEIGKLESLKLSDTQRLERVRDVFLLGYYTGQRWGDYSKFNKKMFENNTIKLMQDKGAKRVSIPIDDKVINIMERYNWVLPNIAQQNFNEYLKEVCKIAGINQIVSRTYNFGGKKETKQFEKWELISSHTARRSFATNMYLSNQLNMLHIMRITGHSTEKDFRKYICFTDEENAEIIRAIQKGKKQPSPLAKVV